MRMQKSSSKKSLKMKADLDTAKLNLINMTDDQMNDLLTDFGNSHSIAVGGNIQVVKSAGHTSMKPRDGFDSMRTEDTWLLGDILRGAESFLIWLRRRAGE